MKLNLKKKTQHDKKIEEITNDFKELLINDRETHDTLETPHDTKKDNKGEILNNLRGKKISIMGKPKKNKRGSKANQREKKTISPVVTFDSTCFKHFCDAAKIHIPSQRKANLDVFFEEYAMTKIDSDTFDNIIKYLEEHYPLGNCSKPTPYSLQEHELEKLNVWHSTITRLFPLYDLSISSVKKNLLRKFFEELSLQLDSIIQTYHSLNELNGQKYFYYALYINEKTQWFIENINEYMSIFLDDINSKKEKDIILNSNNIFFILKTYILLLSFSKYHILFSEHNKILINKGHGFFKNKQLSIIINGAIDLNFKSTLESIENAPSTPDDVLLWQSMFEKIHSLFSAFEPWLSETYPVPSSFIALSSEMIQERIELLKEINVSSPDSGIFMQISDTLISSLDELISYKHKTSVTSINYSEPHYKLCKQLSSFFRIIDSGTDDVSKFMHHIISEIIKDVEYKLMYPVPDNLFNIQDYISASKIINSSERNIAIDQFFNNKRIEINSLALDRIVYEIKKYVNELHAKNTHKDPLIKELETVSLWHTTLKSLLPLCGVTNKNYEVQLNAYSFSWTLSALKRLILDYKSKSTKLSACEHSFYFYHIKEKLQWYDEEVKLYSELQGFNKNTETQRDRYDSAFWRNIREIISFYTAVLSFCENNFLLINEAKKLKNDAMIFKKFIEEQMSENEDYEFTTNIDLLTKILDAEISSNNWIKLYEKIYFKITDVYDYFELQSKNEYLEQEINLEKIDVHINDLIELNQINIDEKNIGRIVKSVTSSLELLLEYPGQNNDANIIKKYNNICIQVLNLMKKIYNRPNKDNSIYEACEEFTYKISDDLLRSIVKHFFNDLKTKNSFSSIKEENEKNSNLEVATSTQLPLLTDLEHDNNLSHDDLIHDLEELKKNEAENFAFSREKEMAALEIKLELQRLNEEDELDHNKTINEIKQNHEKYVQSLYDSHENETKKKHEQHRNDIKNLNAEHKKKIQKINRSLKEDKKSLNSSLARKKEELSNKHQTIINAKEQQNREKLKELSTLLDSQIQELEAASNKKIESIETHYEQQYKLEEALLFQEFERKKSNLLRQQNEIKMDLQKKYHKKITIFQEYLDGELNGFENLMRHKLLSFRQNLDIELSNMMSQSLNEFQEKIAREIYPQFQLGKNSSANGQSPFLTKLVIPDYLRTILNKLDNMRIEYHIVGGRIRNHLLGILDPDDDFDIAVNAHPDQILSILGTQLKQSSVQSKLIKWGPIDFWCDPWGDDPIASLRNRDLTINTFICDNTDGIIKDPLNARDDLHNPYLVILGNSFQRIQDDPSIILRCLRLSIKLEKNITSEVWYAIYANAHKISALPLGIYYTNIAHIFYSKGAYDCFSLICQHDLLRFVFPFLMQQDVLDDENLYKYITQKIKILSSNKDSTDSRAILALMMLIPIVKNGISSKNIVNFIQDRLSKCNLFQCEDLRLIQKVICAYCIGLHDKTGYIAEFIQFSKDQAQSTPEDQLNSSHTLTMNYSRQHNRVVVTPSNEEFRYQNHIKKRF